MMADHKHRRTPADWRRLLALCVASWLLPVLALAVVALLVELQP